MSETDIVERLRVIGRWQMRQAWASDIYPPVLEAADEIERLRKRIAELENVGNYRAPNGDLLDWIEELYNCDPQAKFNLKKLAEFYKNNALIAKPLRKL